MVSLFGSNLLRMSSIDIDSILRKVHKELVAIEGQEAPPNADQKCQQRQIKTVTEKCLESLCVKHVETEENTRKKKEFFEQEILSKKMIVSSFHLVTHIMKEKFSHLPLVLRNKLQRNLVQSLRRIFPVAEKFQDQSGDEPKRSVVREQILSMHNHQMDPNRTIKPEDYTFVIDSNGQKVIDIETRTKVVWQEIDKEKRLLMKTKSLMTPKAAAAPGGPPVASKTRPPPQRHAQPERLIQPRVKSVITHFEFPAQEAAPQPRAPGEGCPTNSQSTLGAPATKSSEALRQINSRNSLAQKRRQLQSAQPKVKTGDRVGADSPDADRLLSAQFNPKRLTSALPRAGFTANMQSVQRIESVPNLDPRMPYTALAASSKAGIPTVLQSGDGAQHRFQGHLNSRTLLNAASPHKSGTSLEKRSLSPAQSIPQVVQHKLHLQQKKKMHFHELASQNRQTVLNNVLNKIRSQMVQAEGMELLAELEHRQSMGPN